MIPLNAQTIKHGLELTTKALIKAAPTISVLCGVGLMTGATVKTGIETPKLKTKLEELDKKEDISHKEYLKEKTKVLLYHLGWSFVMWAIGIALILGGFKVKCVEAAVATAAFATKSEEVEKLEKKVIEKYGPKEYEKLKEDIIKDDVMAHPLGLSTVINTGRGTTLCYDPVFHDYYLSDLDYIRKTAAEINDEMCETRWDNPIKTAYTYNEWRDALDLPGSTENTNDIHGDSVGNVEDFGRSIGWLNRRIELLLTVFKLDDDTVVHVIGFTRNGGPKWHLNLSDRHRESIETDANGREIDDDDETDMKWRRY